MEKIARCIYLISLITGWFAFRYDRQKNCVRYSRIVYIFGRLEFYLFSLLGFGYGIIYDDRFFFEMHIDVILALLIFLQGVQSFLTILKFYSHLTI